MKTNTLYWSVELSESQRMRVLEYPKVAEILKSDVCKQMKVNKVLHSTMLFVGKDADKAIKGAMGVTEPGLIEQNWDGREVQLVITGVAWDQKAVALMLDRTFPCQNEHVHITLALAGGVKPVYSNEMIASSALSKKLLFGSLVLSLFSVASFCVLSDAPLISEGKAKRVVGNQNGTAGAGGSKSDKTAKDKKITPPSQPPQSAASTTTAIDDNSYTHPLVKELRFHPCIFNPDTLIERLRLVPNFPKPGVNFVDQGGWIANNQCSMILAMAMSSQCMYSPTTDNKRVTKVAMLESRGFYIAGRLAKFVEVSAVMLRKKG